MKLVSVNKKEEQNIFLKNYEFVTSINGKLKTYDVTASNYSSPIKDSFDSIVIRENELAIGIIHKDVFFVSYDSNGDGVIDISDESYQAMEIIREYFKGNINE